jgi:hypothetical protein
VTAYKVYRGTSSGGETLLTTLGNVLTYTDSTVTGGTPYWYQVSAVNSVSEGSRTTEQSATPTAVPPLLTDDFETGTLNSAWNLTGPLAISSVSSRGSWDLRDQCAGSACWVWRQFASNQSATDLWVQTYVYVAARDSSTTYLLKLRSTTSGSGTSVFGLLLNNKGKLSYRNDVTSKTTTGNTVLGTGAWHKILVHLTVATAGHVDVWVDGTRDATLSKNDNFGTTPIAKLQLGENSSGGNFDVRFDDINVTATAQTP